MIPRRFRALAPIVTIAITGCTGTNSKYAAPTEFEDRSAYRFQTIDQFVQSFQRAGADVLILDGGNLIDVPYLRKNLGSAPIKDSLEKVCLALKGKEGNPKRGDNLRTAWYYLKPSGGPFVDYSQEVESAISVVSATRKIRLTIPVSSLSKYGRDGFPNFDYTCTKYSRGVVPEYPNEQVQLPIFVASHRCEVQDTNLCHWTISKTQPLIGRVRWTLVNELGETQKLADLRQRLDAEESARKQALRAEYGHLDAKIQMEIQEETSRRQSLQPIVKTIGNKICRKVEGFERLNTGLVVGGQQVYGPKEDRTYLVSGFTEKIADNRIQIRVAGIQSISGNGTSNAINHIDGDFSIRRNELTWDDAINWEPCQ